MEAATITMSQQKDKEKRVNQQVAVVTGSSTGVGFETSLTLARNGFFTYATMCNMNKSKNIAEIANTTITSYSTRH
jgi:NAD(P)-dependent dehydrogenase (short-subunit alcohol dehydrogenase family)